MNKGLEALNKIRFLIDFIQRNDEETAYYLNTIETELKRLEKQDDILRIIKRCPTEITNLIEIYDNWEEYAKDFKKDERWFKSRVEFDLLKEWFK